MARTAFVLGGTGFIGSVVARRFVEGGWDVTVASRGQLAAPPELDGIPIRRAELDRSADGELASALGDGVDALVDVVAYSRTDATQLAALGDRLGTLLVISTGAVYVDGHGRHLFASYRTDPLPDVPVPIPESQATVRPDDETYPVQKAAVEQTLVEANSAPTSPSIWTSAASAISRCASGPKTSTATSSSAERWKSNRTPPKVDHGSRNPEPSDAVTLRRFRHITAVPYLKRNGRGIGSPPDQEMGLRVSSMSQHGVRARAGYLPALKGAFCAERPDSCSTRRGC